ncbi:MAG TPA: ABC transporter permease, partial [Alphaproteobacteria bacterium]|nr:ABC transporter permease [Alphaproteobacteria bacterium]
MRLEPRGTTPLALALGAPVAAVGLTLVLAILPLWAAGAPVGTAFAAMAEGALGSRFALSETLART